MKSIILILFSLTMLIGSGCMIYTQYPPSRTISGQIVREDNGQPVPFAVVWFYSERSHIGMATNHGIDATAYADKNGKFSVTAKLNEKVTVLVYKDGGYQKFDLIPFPATNTLDGIVWKIKWTGEQQA